MSKISSLINGILFSSIKKRTTMRFDKELVDTIRDFMLTNGKTIATAESVTSGNIQSALSLAENATDFFEGGITTYNIRQKNQHLEVDPVNGNRCGCVSPSISAVMAQKVCKLFNADYGVAITGFASLVPEKGIKELYAFVAIAKNGQLLRTQKITAEKKDSEEVQLYYTNETLRILTEVLNNISLLNVQSPASTYSLTRHITTEFARKE